MRHVIGDSFVTFYTVFKGVVKCEHFLLGGSPICAICNTLVVFSAFLFRTSLLKSDNLKEESILLFFNTFKQGIRRSLTSEDDSMDEMNYIDYLPYKTKHTKQPQTSTPPPPTAYDEHDHYEHGRYIDEELDQSPVLDNKHDEPIYIKECAFILSKSLCIYTQRSSNLKLI